MDLSVIMPLIHDQHSNAERLEYLGYAPPSLPRKVLFPHTKSFTVPPKCVSDGIDVGAIEKVGEENVDICSKSTVSHFIVEEGEEVSNRRKRNTGDHVHQLSAITADSRPIQRERKIKSKGEKDETETSVFQAVTAAVSCLERLLRLVTDPPHRLKCACLGRDLRADPLENGLKKCCDVVFEEIRRSDDITRASDVLGCCDTSLKTTGDALSDSCLDAERLDGASNDKKDVIGTSRIIAEQKNEKIEHEEIDEEDGTDWQDFPGGLRLATHHLTAPEETNFLYEELFEQRTYIQHGIKLNEDDLIIDIGEIYC